MTSELEEIRNRLANQLLSGPLRDIESIKNIQPGEHKNIIDMLRQIVDLDKKRIEDGKI